METQKSSQQKPEIKKINAEMDVCSSDSSPDFSVPSEIKINEQGPSPTKSGRISNLSL
jgi:hypothetical protein